VGRAGLRRIGLRLDVGGLDVRAEKHSCLVKNFDLGLSLRPAQADPLLVYGSMHW
jgi:hypothetical protein